jgi:hypothetical protein
VIARDRRRKLPVPAPWQGAVRSAMEDLRVALDLEPAAVAVTLVEPEHWVAADGARRAGLQIWLLAQAKTHRYRADLATGTVERVVW